jgi:hypothetical protein
VNIRERKLLYEIAELLVEVPFVSNNCDIGTLTQYAHELHKVSNKVHESLLMLVTDDYHYAVKTVEELKKSIDFRKKY